MAVLHYSLTLTGSAQALSSVTNATTDSIRTLTIQPAAANGGAVYVGASGVTNAAYGVYIPAPASSIPPAPFMLGETQSQHGHFKLSDVYVTGSNADVVKLLVVTI